MKKLLKKRIDVKGLAGIHGGSYYDSGGNETGSTDGGCDTYSTWYNDDCQVSSTTTCNNYY